MLFFIVVVVVRCSFLLLLLVAPVCCVLCAVLVTVCCVVGERAEQMREEGKEGGGREGTMNHVYIVGRSPTIIHCPSPVGNSLQQPITNPTTTNQSNKQTATTYQPAVNNGVAAAGADAEPQ